MDEVLLARRLSGLSEQSGRIVYIALGQVQAGKKHLTEHESINTSIKLPSQVKALLTVLLGSIQIVPFVVDPGQTKMRFAGNR
jgi:hypothetical protein